MNVVIDWYSLSVQSVTTLAHFLWQGALIGFVLALVLRFCSLRTANTRYLIACTAFAILPICVVVTFGVVHHHGKSIFVVQNRAEQTKSASLAALPRAEQSEPPEFGSVGVVEREQSSFVPTSQPPLIQNQTLARKALGRSCCRVRRRTCSDFICLASWQCCCISRARCGAAIDCAVL